MERFVWVSGAVGHGSNLRPFRNDVGERDHSRLVAIQQLVERGETLDRSDFPQEIFAAADAEEQHYRLPHLFFGYGYWVVSGVAADILRTFDLGRGGLYPVRVLKKDRRSPVDGEWHCLNFGNQKTVLVPEQSRNIRQRAQGRYKQGPASSDFDLTVSSAALLGPDIWVDTQLWDAFFLSEALGQALRNAKVDGGFMLSKCRVVGA